jgi:nickel/cobalt transporter (NicO) family protein
MNRGFVHSLTKAGLLALPALLLADASVHAQVVHHPFAVGAYEGAVGHQNGLGAWLLAQESGFYRMLTGAVRATKTSTSATLGLIGLSFAYGVFHAAGPGHGKAVIASYMVSNEVALRRGLIIAVLAAVLQGLVAVALVGTAIFVFNATAQRMTAAASILEVGSYLAIVALGLALVWRKGRALLAALRPAPVLSGLLSSAGGTLAFEPARTPVSSRFSIDDGSVAHVHGPDCGHVHMPDPSLLAGTFDLRAAAVTIMTAGARPCSGAILVLVFAAAQGLFMTGVTATFAMSLGTALTTGALATLAVFTKDIAVRLAELGSARGAMVGLVVEVVAAACVLAFGLILLIAAFSGSALPS